MLINENVQFTNCTCCMCVAVSGNYYGETLLYTACLATQYTYSGSGSVVVVELAHFQ